MHWGMALEMSTLDSQPPDGHLPALFRRSDHLIASSFIHQVLTCLMAAVEATAVAMARNLRVQRCAMRGALKRQLLIAALESMSEINCTGRTAKFFCGDGAGIAGRLVFPNA